MSAVISPDDPIVVGCDVIQRRDMYVGDPKVLATFSSFHIACVAVKLMRKPGDWLRAAELMLDDEDFLTVQVLARRLNKKQVASEKSSIPTQLFSESETGITRADAFSGSLEDLI